MLTVPSPLFRLAAVAALAVAVSGCGGGTVDRATQAPSDADGQVAPMEQVAACMQEKGWNATYNSSDESMEVRDVPEAQQAQSRADNEACLEAAGQLEPAEALSQEDLRQLYDHEVETAQCLRDKGVDVPEVSSEQAFVDSYSSGSAFSAYSYIGDVPQDRWEELNRDCPQTPEGW